MRGFYECFCVSAGGGGRVGPPLTRPSPSEYFDLVSESYADVAIFFSRVSRARAAAAFFVCFETFFFAFLLRASSFSATKNFCELKIDFRFNVNRSLVHKTIFFAEKLCL